jgi:hypothetical protein
MQMQDFGLWEIELIVGVFCLYFFPSLIAFLRGHKNSLAIFLLNFLWGWTGIGWVIALVWSVMK